MSPALSLVADRAEPVALPETTAAKVRRLTAEAKDLAREHVASLVQQIADLEVIAAEIADGGEAYPPGVRDVCRRLAQDCESRVQTLEAISART